MNPKNLFSEAAQMFVNPKSYFAGVNKSENLMNVILKALAYSAIAGILYFLNELIHPAFINVGNSLSAFVLALVYGLVGLFLGGFVMWILAMIVGGKPSYLACLSVTASLYPVVVLLVLMGQVLSFAGALSWAVMIATWIYALYLIFCALSSGLQSDEKSSKTMVGVLVLIILFAAIIPLIAGFFVREYQGIRMQANQRMQGLTGMWRRPAYGQNLAMMRFPAAAPGQNMGMPANTAPVPGAAPTVGAPNAAPAAARPAYTMTPQNYEMIKKMINSNTKMTADQKKAALARLEAAQKNQGK